MEKVENKKIYCPRCESMLGFFDKGVLVFYSNKTSFTRIDVNNKKTTKCRKCSNLISFSVVRVKLENEVDYKLRSKLLLKMKNKKNNV